MKGAIIACCSRGGGYIAIAVMFLCSVPAVARAQSNVSVTADPLNVPPGGTVTLNATITAAGYDCGYGCAVIGLQSYLQISGSNGYYASTTDPYSGGYLELPGSDPGPGQTLQPVTYTASGGFHYDLCYYQPGWEFYGCVYGYGSYDESGSNYVSVGPAVAPSALSVSPASGAGPRQTFVFQYSSVAGESDIETTWQIFHQYGQTGQSCVVGFFRSSGVFVLYGDTGWQDQQTAPPNSMAVLENSQCRLHMPNTTVAGVGNNLTIVADVSFKSGYFGDKAVVAYGYSNGGGYGTPLVTYWTARPQLNTPPDPVLPSQTMTLNGVEFGTGGTVKFNACDGTGIAGTVVAWGSSSIAVQVPAGAVSGPVCVIVNGQASNTASLTVQTGPVITSVSPRWGPASTPSSPSPITLHGVHFGTAPGVVKWDGVVVGFTAWGDDHVTLNVPEGAVTGHLTVVRNGVSSNGIGFEVGDEGQEYYHTDSVGSVRMITGYDGAVLERHDYLPFGLEWPPGPDQAHLGFASTERDAETQTSGQLALNYLGARHLQTIGRFTSADPVTITRARLIDPQLQNLFVYARNNPLRYVDPDGRIVETIWDAANVGLDLASLVRNIAAGNVGGAVVDAIGLTLDGLATAVPVVPGGAGTAIKGYRAARRAEQIAANAAKGRKFEEAVLKALKAVKNTKRIKPATKAAYRIPDAFKDALMVEAKNVKELSLTDQLRDFLNWTAHNEDGIEKIVIVVPEGTKIDAELEPYLESGILYIVKVAGDVIP